MCIMVYIQNYYRGSNGALVFIDLCDFTKSDKREGIRLQIENLIQCLDIKTGVKIPCLLIGTKVRNYSSNLRNSMYVTNILLSL